MTNFKLTVLAAASFLLLSMTVFSTEAAAQNARRQRYSAQQRAQIRATPILERPSRPFHFYGNTVRRNADSKTTPKSSSERQVATAKNPASINVSKADTSNSTNSQSPVGVTVDQKAKAESASQALIVVGSFAETTQKAELKSVLVSHVKSVQATESNAELNGPIEIHLTDLNGQQPLNE